MAREMRSPLLVVSTPSAPPGRIDVESLLKSEMGLPCEQVELSLIHISEPTRPY